MTCSPGCRNVGRTQAHCTVCHRTFSGVYYFDSHRRGGECVELEHLVEEGGVWSTSEGHAHRRTVADRLNNRENQ